MDPLTITITAPFQRQLSSGGWITFDHSRLQEGVWMRHWDAQGNPLELRDLTYEEYEQFRKEHPELNMPELKPPPAGAAPQGNTVGRVVGESPAADAKAAEANPPVAAETAGESSLGTKILDGTQVTLDVIGLVPGAGEIADLANAGISALRGDFVGAGLSLASAIPFAGWFGTGAKFARRGAKLVDGAAEVGQGAVKQLDEVAGAGAKQGDEAVGTGAKQTDEAPAANNAQVRRAKKLKCGERGSYEDLKKKSGDNQFDRDHVPSKAALIERAKQLADQKGVLFTPEMLNDIVQLADAVAIPKAAHRGASPTYGQRGKPLIGPDAADLRAAVERDLNAMLKELRETDPRCYKKYKRFASKLMKALSENKDVYDDFLLDVIGG